MIRFAMTRGHEHTLDPVRRDPTAPRIEIARYDRLIRSRSLPRVPHVFTDLDRLDPWTLELAGVIHRGLARAGVPVLNDPARVKTRFALLRALHEAGLNDFNAYRPEEGIWPERYPVFLRRDAGHGAPLSDLLQDRDALEAAIEAALANGTPESSLVIVEYCAEPVAPDLYRKLAAQRVGDRVFQQISVYHFRWLVKYGKRNFATEAFYRRDLEEARTNPHAEALWPAFEIAGIEWGRADFGIVGGRIQVYEINTNPQLFGAGDHPSPFRVETIRIARNALSEALHKLDAEGRGQRGRVRVDDRRLSKARRPGEWSVRTRTRP